MEQPTKEFALKLISYLPNRPDYETWINVISAIGNSFSENEALDILLSHFRDEKPGEHLYKLRNQLRRISFATLVYLAKENGYKPSAVDYGESPSTDFRRTNKPTKQDEKVKVVTTARLNADEKYYLWAESQNELFEELCAISQNAEKVGRYEAERRWTANFSNDPSIPKSEKRLYDVMINQHYHNKPPDNIIKANLHYFKYYRLTADRLINAIVHGFAIMPGILQTVDGKFESKSEYWIYSDLLFIDVDGTITLDEALKIPETQSALFLYSTPSHTPEKHRFRIVFAFPGRVRDSTEYYKVFDYYTKIYKADPKCRNLNRFFYGNDNAIIFNIQSGEISQYQNGKKL